MKNKICTKCGINKGLDAFHFDKRRPDGRYSECRNCRNLYLRNLCAQQGLLRPPKPVPPVKTHKPCSKCGAEKALTEFSKDKRATTGRTPECKLCESERKKEAYAVNPSTFLERKKAYKTRNPEKIREAARKYKQENPEKICAHTTARNARKQSAIPAWEADALAAEVQWRKSYPGMTLDHIVPITPPVSASLGGRPMHKSNRTFVGPLIPIVYGLHTQANWQPLKNRENARKNNRDWPDSPWSDHV